MRWLALVLCFAAACKKSSSLVDDNTKKDPGSDNALPGDQADKTDKADKAPPKKPIDASIDSAIDAAPDAHLMGGDNSAANRHDGHPHGPGGPVDMGAGPPCDAAHDHCLRPGTWFAADNIIAGKFFRALPVYELDGKWYDWGEGEERTGRLFHTKLATASTLHHGDPVILFNTSQPPQWATSEYDGLTSSNWEIAVVNAVNTSAKTFTVDGAGDPFPIDVARVITEQK
jgi:hypothetical protein